MRNNNSDIWDVLVDSIIWLVATGYSYNDIMDLPVAIYLDVLEKYNKYIEMKNKSMGLI